MLTSKQQAIEEVREQKLKSLKFLENLMLTVGMFSLIVSALSRELVFLVVAILCISVPGATILIRRIQKRKLVITIDEEYKKALMEINARYYEYDDLSKVVQEMIEDHLLREEGRAGQLIGGKVYFMT